MAIQILDSVAQPASFSVGPTKFQLLTYRILSGQTSGTITADNLRVLKHVVIEDLVNVTVLPTFSGNVATLSAFTVPAETAASLEVQDLTYTAVADLGQDGNSITIEYTAGGTAGDEVVTVVGNAISVEIEDGVSTALEVEAAINGSAAALALVSVAVTGTGSNAQVAAAATALAGGVSGGARGTLMCIGE